MLAPQEYSARQDCGTLQLKSMKNSGAAALSWGSRGSRSAIEQSSVPPSTAEERTAGNEAQIAVERVVLPDGLPMAGLEFHLTRTIM